ncbi:MULTISPECIES: tRNA glutamyl-Q(34) synthetase GluQRS [Sphingobium]|uniref:tRNA glutamyl-Q(34) synthetase GluQRS n=1 Tax=Sphingobium sp. MI1205 TaxID=407020 RepID=UPI00077024D8|nr:tRNA glutamyl-Q(34) synthetase GluQRS [Sphingobium sp. MI1205]AMK17000.1 glutamyl/glutaminyl-tRNA synthetase class Ic catalytic domain-containing protein [Sphingobium sp. MI1205]
MTLSLPPQHMVTRFAPSPTGRLHIGHGWSALLAMDLARANGGSFRLRIEDIDGTRSRPEHVAAIIDDLNWLGVAWDGEIVFQSTRLDDYAIALTNLRAQDLLYPCFCTRADIAGSTTAPHGPEGPIYPGTCRTLSAAERTERIAAGQSHAWRLDMAKAVAQTGPLHWRNLPFPPAGTDPVEAEALPADPLSAGDVVLARKDAPASYHLSCTLDDAAMDVTHVLRGADLFAATHIHRLLQALLGLPSPVYCHHPLLVGADGRRLAKRDGSIAIVDLRAQGVDPQRLATDLRNATFPVGISLAKA